MDAIKYQEVFKTVVMKMIDRHIADKKGFLEKAFPTNSSRKMVWQRVINQNQHVKLIDVFNIAKAFNIDPDILLRTVTVEFYEAIDREKEASKKNGSNHD